MSAAAPMIRLEAFEKRYGPVEAVKRLDLEVRRGECFALLGPNGSGKTSIIRALVGLHRPSAGRILVDGSDVVREPDRVKQQLSYVPQRVSMPDLLTAREVATVFARLKGVRDSRVEEVLDLFALTDSADRRTREFSGGMMQRLGLAVAFLQDVPLFVLDEPSANLDLLGVDCLRKLLGELKKKNTTIVFSSHLMHSAMRLADRVAVLVEGQLVMVEQAPLLEAAVTQQTTIRVVVGKATDEMVDAARGAGADRSTRNARQLFFTAVPRRRLEIIRAIEGVGATIEEVHSDPPDWDALVRGYFNGQEHGS